MVSQKAVLNLIKKGEDEKLIFKSYSLTKNVNELAGTISSIAGNKGGVLLIGINEENTPEGIEYSKDDENLIIRTCSDTCTPIVSSKVSHIHLEDGCVYHIKIAKTKKNHNSKKKAEIIEDDGTFLFNHLYQACNILRGPVSADEYKTYIFPIMFFKRLSDVYDDEIRTALEESEGDEEFALMPENHRFIIPEDCHWDDIRAKSSNIGSAIQFAMRGIQKENPDTLFGIFDSFDEAEWTNKEKLSDDRLKDLIEHFSSLKLDNNSFSADIMGQAYEYLIKKFADLTKDSAGEFYTPRAVVKLLVKLLDPKAGDTIYDPACGTGGMLIEAKNHIGEQKLTLGKLYGQEKNPSTSAIARMNLFLHGANDFRIVKGDTLRNPVFIASDELKTFDCVIANPPFSLKLWGEDIWVNDPYGRNIFGVPSDSNGDFAWIQHMIKSMSSDTGRMAVVLPHGVLFRGDNEGRIRQKLIESDMLECVIGLAGNLFYGTNLAACILILHRNKVAEHKGKTIMVDGSTIFKAGRAQNFLEDEHVEKLYAWASDWKDVEGICKVVSIDQIKKYEYNLNISHYVEKITTEDSITINEAIKNLKDNVAAAYAAEDKFISLLKREGLFNE
ncbi:N-6 DNA methylase [Methanolobus profundi]|uniref:site-specific DNA-methyltransferase (adenine-specific) n=1 Tax=Methanolobus profundi TaxID=487685 RepID=A0A1I4QJW8_9EURY|nr:N-6 DNA methylase [Methanolobus profundi]SFM40324.1 type I restriction enzyme M protein [Methanolobus profundi]